MSSANSRKRPAPGASPVPQMAQAYPAQQTSMSNAEFLRWNQGLENASYSDTSAYNMNSYGENALSQPQFDQAASANSTQLTRRPMNHQIVSTTGAQRYDNSANPWGGFAEDLKLDPQNMNGAMEENDNIELLEEKAAVAKRDAQSKRKQIPPFVQKLSSFLDESKNTELIRWSDQGDSFVVLDEDEFAKKLIPELFKHNNYASFVRQLNMYGFHKRVGLSDNSMKASERKNKSPSEYYNPYFKRGHPNLLWLINKPKNGTGKTGKSRSRVKQEGNEVQDRDSEDDGQDVEEIYGNNVQAPRALSAAPELGPLQRRDVTVLQNQLQEIQKQQGAITHAIARLRKDHNSLYEQAVAFQTLHDRHESSINAILTFLATVYNRSLDGQNSQNFAQMFANGVPHDQQHQGSVVDIGDVPDQQQNPGNLSPLRRQQRLLMAPPGTAGGSTKAASSPAGSNFSNQHPSPHPGAVEELFDNSPADTTQIKDEPQHPQQHPRQGMMNIITNTNAQTRPNNNAMEFPEMLSHYENANGNTPLTTEQRNTMLNLIASTASAPGSNNALVSPIPPQQPSMVDLGFTQKEIDDLVRLQNEQESRITDIKNAVQPLSPSGSIPGLNDNNYFNGTDLPDPSASNLDLDQFLESGAFYNGSSPMAGADYGYDQFGHASTGMDDSFDLRMGSASDNGRGRIVDTMGSSEAATPETGEMEEANGTNGMRSPVKRQRKN